MEKKSEMELRQEDEYSEVFISKFLNSKFKFGSESRIRLERTKLATDTILVVSKVASKMGGDVVDDVDAVKTAEEASGPSAVESGWEVEEQGVGAVGVV